LGINNTLQPGLVKEIIIAETLGHKVISSKNQADACDPCNSNILYEHLSFTEAGSGQFDRMFKTPKEKRKKSLKRITRNKLIFFAIFYKNDPVKCKIIYETPTKYVKEEAERQRDKCYISCWV